jgi:L-seryl-tRNA(Ser) seleniumtransferase
MTDSSENKNLLRALPSVDALLRTPEALRLRERVGAERLTALARAVTVELRAKIRAQHSKNGEHSREALIIEAVRRLELACEREASLGLRSVINATGVILHTNLGRAPLAEAVRRAISNEAAR